MDKYLLRPNTTFLPSAARPIFYNMSLTSRPSSGVVTLAKIVAVSLQFRRHVQPVTTLSKHFRNRKMAVPVECGQPVGS
jgi:hypothetical protein